MIEYLLKILKKKKYTICDTIETISKYCSYDLKNERKNYEQLLRDIFLSWRICPAGQGLENLNIRNIIN